jgi:uncharacterized membrane protein|uniref:Uncharacterized protein n=1 Tax=viral metagenome TaxID=1070528 RepID=A0A6C0BE03_9ZZZZ
MDTEQTSVAIFFMIIVTVTIILCVLLYLYFAKLKADLKIDNLKNDRNIQQKLKEHTEVNDYYTALIPALSNKLQNKYGPAPQK